jgi:hypothetical protein
MVVRGRLTALISAALFCASVSHALAQTAPKGAAKPTAAKPEPATAGGSEPTLIGQFGTWGAYTATPNGGKKVCFALAKPSSSKTNPPNRPRDRAGLVMGESLPNQALASYPSVW